MNIKKFGIKVLLIAVLWVLYVTVKGVNEHATYITMTGLGLLCAHLCILEFVDMIFDRKSKKLPEANSEDLEFILVWSDEKRKATVDTVKAISKKLVKEYGIGARCFYGNDATELYTDKVKVKFITKVDEYRGLKYDKAFGFNNKPYARPLIEYIVEKHDI